MWCVCQVFLGVPTQPVHPPIASIFYIDARPPNLLAILTDALAEIERDTQISPDDPTIIEFKRSLLRSISELETQEEKRAA